MVRWQVHTRQQQLLLSTQMSRVDMTKNHKYIYSNSHRHLSDNFSCLLCGCVWLNSHHIAVFLPGSGTYDFFRCKQRKKAGSEQHIFPLYVAIVPNSLRVPFLCLCLGYEYLTRLYRKREWQGR